MSKTKSLTPKTSRSDIFMSIKPEHMHNISTRAKNHEYRRYLFPASVRRIWFYTTAPQSRLEYVARVSHGKTPGEVPEDGGIGNEDFNAGMKVSRYAYEILDLWRLREPISLKRAISDGWLKGAPQKYCWVPIALLERCSMDRQDHVFSRPEERPERKGDDREEAKKASSPAGRKKISDFFTQSDPKD